MQKFKLSAKFLSEYEGKQPNWGFGALSYFTFKRTYARLKEDGSQEEYYDTVKRVVEGVFGIQKNYCINLGLPWDNNKSQRSAQRMFQKIWEFKFTPPGRGFWVMGTPVIELKGSAALNNCGFRSTQNIAKEFGEPFAWSTEMLMLGVGVGFDTRGAETLTIIAPSATESTFIIPDTREGWGEAVKVLIDSYDGREGRKTIIFDASQVRPAGSIINTFGGTASGPEPLLDGLESIRAVLDSLDGELITSVAITDIMNYIGKFVVAGNVRRSAEIAFSTFGDRHFIEMKDPDLFPAELADRRWASNNSLFAQDDSDFSTIISNIAKNGEPGLLFLDNCRHYGRIKDGWIPETSSKFDNCLGTNPCSEQLLEDGELCCLVETYPANHSSIEEFEETLKYAYLYAKTVTLLPTHSTLTNSIILRNRRIGLSQSGVQQAIKKFGTKKYFSNFCDKAYGTVQHWDRIYSRWLGVPESKRTTSVKPSGTVSLLVGATPGVHYTHAKKYFRTVRLAANSPLLQPLIDSGYKIELAIPDLHKLLKWKGETTQGLNWDNPEDVIYNWKDIGATDRNHLIKIGATVVVYFPVEESNFTKSKYDVSIWEQFSVVREMQNLWADNSVSVTITFKPEESHELLAAIEYNAPYLKALSFLALTGHRYLQAPYTDCTDEEFEEYSKSLKPIDFSNSSEANIAGSKFCDGDKCEL